MCNCGCGPGFVTSLIDKYKLDGLLQPDRPGHYDLLYLELDETPPSSPQRRHAIQHSTALFMPAVLSVSEGEVASRLAGGQLWLAPALVIQATSSFLKFLSAECWFYVCRCQKPGVQLPGLDSASLSSAGALASMFRSAATVMALMSLAEGSHPGARQIRPIIMLIKTFVLLSMALHRVQLQGTGILDEAR